MSQLKRRQQTLDNIRNVDYRLLSLHTKDISVMACVLCVRQRERVCVYMRVCERERERERGERERQRQRQREKDETNTCAHVHEFHIWYNFLLENIMNKKRKEE